LVGTVVRPHYWAALAGEGGAGGAGVGSGVPSPTRGVRLNLPSSKIVTRYSTVPVQWASYTVFGWR
jgi:hypothetical protein